LLSSEASSIHLRFEDEMLFPALVILEAQGDRRGREELLAMRMRDQLRAVAGALRRGPATVQS